MSFKFTPVVWKNMNKFTDAKNSSKNQGSDKPYRLLRSKEKLNVWLQFTENVKNKFVDTKTKLSLKGVENLLQNYDLAYKQQV